MKSGIIMTDILEDFAIYGTVKVGERGQIVIPSKAREDFNLRPGDLLLVLRGPGFGGIGLGLIKADLVKEFMEKLMRGMEIRRRRGAKEK
jgi:AbrB family looped-hinge helix DNA binding protein